MKWSLLIAMRFMSTGRGSDVMSFMSRVSIVGLVLGICVLLVVLSVMNGFETELRESVLSVLPHGVLESRDGHVDWRALQRIAESHPDVLGTAPYVSGFAMLIANGQIVGANVTGILPGQEEAVSAVGQHLHPQRDGSTPGLGILAEGAFQVVIGSGLAKRLAVGEGDRVTMMLPEVRFTLGGPIPRMKRFIVAGVFSVGADLDGELALIHIGDAGRLFRVRGAQGLRLAVRDLFLASDVVYQLLEQAALEDLYGQSWIGSHGNLYDVIQMQKSTMFLLLLLLVAVAAFNVVSSQVVTVTRRRSEIAILRTMGASPGSIMLLFMVHGTIVALLGVGIGVAFGVLLAMSIGDIYAALDGWLNLGLMDEYFIHYLPSRVELADVVAVAGISLILCVLATIYPARRAARMHAVEALH